MLIIPQIFNSYNLILSDPHSARRQLFNPDDYQYQPGTKERLFEEEQEVTWDKGSSGLVFYTDAQYWHAKKADEERNCDDWTWICPFIIKMRGRTLIRLKYET